jgi:hypothetical protein
MVVVEIDFSHPAEGSADSWQQALDDALARGCSGLWYARFPVGPQDGSDFDRMLGFECEWHRMSRGRPVVTICPFIVGELDGPATIATLGRVAEVHTGVLVPGEDGAFDVLRPD